MYVCMYVYERINAMGNRRTGGHMGGRLGNGKTDLKGRF